MAPLERLAAPDLRQVIVAYRDALRAHQEALNRLNVYPVPDGDTGTNMALTLESVVAELGQATEMATVCKAISHGSLMGARGNSGVILSQVLRGLADGCKDVEAADADVLATAFKASSEAAYGAVMRPVEGTILTVVREAASAAEATGADAGLAGMLTAARDAAADALARTPELLPVLKQAGVVDAGGAGFLLLLDAFLQVTTGRPVPEPTPVAPAAARMAEEVGEAHAPGHASEGEVSDLRYEVMFFLEAPDDLVPSFKEIWSGIGDSIVVVGGDGLWNCHIHTDDIGAAIEAALDCGRPKRIRVTDLLEQVQEERWVREAAAEGDGAADGAHEPVPCAVVAVATGDGIRRIFRSLGVQGIVAGGQSMNPSTAQILEAVEGAPADEVVVLPNNKNIIPVAEQVANVAAKKVRVIATTSVAEGFASLLESDPQASADTNAAAMEQASRRVVSGEVTRAVRDSTTELGPVSEGDHLGLCRGRIVVIEPGLVGAATALLDQLVSPEHEILTIIEGEGATAADTRRITEWLSEHRPGVDCEVHHGGQPLYPYLFSAE